MTSRFRLFKPLQCVSDDMLNLDALRFLAAFGVIFFHACHHFDFGPSWNEGPARPLQACVDLFFVISGYVMGAVYFDRIGTPAQIGRFLKARFWRLYPLHFTTFLASLLIGILGARFSAHQDDYDPRCIPANLMLSQAWGGCSHITYNYVSWSVSAEMVMYALFPIFVWASLRSRAGVLALALATAVILQATTWEELRPWYEWMTPWGAVRAFPSFLIGLSLWNYRGMIVRIRGSQSALWILIAFFLLEICEGARSFLLPTVWSIALFACASDLNKGADCAMRFLSPLGSLTYASYMIHNLVLIVFATILSEHLLHAHGTSKNLIVAAAMVLALVLAWPVENLFDEIKRIALRRF